MARPYYLFSSGTLRRKQNTLYLESEAGKKPIPIEDVDSLYVFGELAINTKLLTFLAQKGVPVHFFDYYENYTGTYYPREQLVSGQLLTQQVAHYLDPDKRLTIAREIVLAAVDNLRRNLKYHRNRVDHGAVLDHAIGDIDADREAIPDVEDPMELMAIEGRVRERYYDCFDVILRWDEPFRRRMKRPPGNPTNALLSFGNAMIYRTVLSEIYRTQLNPTVSYLHEPGERRFSLSLDLADVFKPTIVDRVIFKTVNTEMIQPDDFEAKLKGCYLLEPGRKSFIQAYEERLNQTIEHRSLGRKVSYRRLIRLECYKLIKHLMGDQHYEGFRMWW